MPLTPKNMIHVKDLLVLANQRVESVNVNENRVHPILCPWEQTLMLSFRYRNNDDFAWNLEIPHTIPEIPQILLGSSSSFTQRRPSWIDTECSGWNS